MHFHGFVSERAESLVLVEPLQSNVCVSAIKRDLVKSFPHENDSMPFNSPRTYFFPLPFAEGDYERKFMLLCSFFLLVEQ